MTESRNPEMTWRDVGETGVAWDDLTEKSSLKLHSILRYTGRFHYTMWEREIVRPDFFEKTGQFAPIYSMEIEVTDASIDMRQRMTVETVIRLGRTVNPDGETTRIVSQTEQRLKGKSSDGNEVAVASLLKHSIFTRPEKPKEQRRVRELHESLGLGPQPPRTLEILTLLDLSVPPVDFHPHPERKAVTFADKEPQVWGYEQTDPNRHVHAMDYIRVVEAMGWNYLDREGISAADHFYNSCRIVFRAPCFRGERYIRSCRFEPRDERSGGGGLLIGRIFKSDENINPQDATRPAVAIQLGVLPNEHASKGRHDAE